MLLVRQVVRHVCAQAAARLAQADSAAAAAPHAADIGRGGGGGGGSSSADPAAGKDEEAEAEGPSESRAPPPRCRRPVQWQAVRVLRGHTALVTGVAFLGRGGERLASSSGKSSRARRSGAG